MTSSTESDGQRAAERPDQNLTTIGISRETGGALDGFFAGTMDEVRIWNVARSQAQIQAR